MKNWREVIVAFVGAIALLLKQFGILVSPELVNTIIYVVLLVLGFFGVQIARERIQAARDRMR